MKTETQIRQEMQKIVSHEAFQQPRATLEDNPVMAGIQIELVAKLQALMWVISETKIDIEIPTEQEKPHGRRK